MLDENKSTQGKEDDEEKRSKVRKSYQTGNIGNNARVIQGDQNTWVEAVNTLNGGNILKSQFEELLREISQDEFLNEVDRSISQKKTEEIASSLSKVQHSPEDLQYALTDGKNWFSSKAKWVWNKLSIILKGEAAQKTIGTITESAVKGSIQALIG